MVHRGTGWVCFLMLFTLGCSWEEDSSLRTWITLEELDQSAQPTTTDLGVLVAVSTGGGAVVRFDVEGGSIDDAGASTCVPIVGNGTFVVAVYPAGTEAVLTATLGDTEPDAAPLPVSAGDDGGASTVGDAGSDATPTTQVIGIIPGLGIPTPCAALGFHSFGQSSTLVVSLGRAPGNPPPADSGVDMTIGPVDAEPDASTGDATVGDGMSQGESGSPEAASEDGAASPDASDGGNAQ
jgi:hypothetical protein